MGKPIPAFRTFLLVAVLSTLLLAGCGSADQDARDGIAAARAAQSQVPQRVERESNRVVVGDVTLLRDLKTTAVVVGLRSTAGEPLTDLPITVGVRRSGKEIPYNATAGMDWHRTHVAVIPAGGATTWVFQAPTDRRVPAGEPFARVGDPDPQIQSRAGNELPRLVPSWVPNGGTAREPRFFVRNDSQVPQTNVPVFAFAQADGKYVAAGVGILSNLPAEGERTVAVRLAGRPGQGPFSAIAAPTVYR